MSLAEGMDMRDSSPAEKREDDVVLGDDWVAPDSTVERELRESRARRGLFSLNRSPLTRKIITFNLIALNVLVAGILYLNSSRDTLAIQRAVAMEAEVELIADVFEAQLEGEAQVRLADEDAVNVQVTLGNLDLRQGSRVLVFDDQNFLVGETTGTMTPSQSILQDEQGDKPTVISDFLMTLWRSVSELFSILSGDEPVDEEDRLRRLIEDGNVNQTRVIQDNSEDGETQFTALAPIRHAGKVVGTVGFVTIASEIDTVVRLERERVLQMFVVATLVSIALSLVLASTIANPISDLADAAEIGRDRNKRNVAPGRIRIPDLTARPDEIGRLSGALRGMVSALYDRIDSNEQFAADVAHEIKNPLASLRSAIGSLRIVKKDEQRGKLLDVIEHDVRRLDRLVSDISNASRLDSELVKEEEQEFNLLEMIDNLSQYLGEDAKRKGIEFITDLPPHPISITGLEARLAQVFVNLITNAISFCEDGDAIRVWIRRRDNRVLVVVEDTGPGIPEQSLTKIFKRFYSHRPEGDFGNNSGLGLAISKQIVEAHGGVIWAENIRPTEADVTSEPLGARFVVGLPI
ncbi:MAG: sensor histidine kinase [Pseudomonadota bacterium]|jgi:two-component system sensor histidine kinase ChvG|uniref:sensor histidine kinase n=1 Tax=Thalassococcus sp. TaxID=1928858 RepID=UPI001AFD4612|nr:sensor histidine kinase [Thalassococcus sp.]MBO6865981.1 sensor histidine kinase [Thalassococcus sp.]MEC8579465.1 sensor histidine kinase [Pseudomonadota bacterium]